MSNEITQLENEAENAKNQFGAMLKTIRDERLYEDQYESFEAYCQLRWGFTREQAHQIIHTAESVAARKAVTR